LNEQNCTFYIIDHHKTNKEKFGNAGNCIFNDAFAGCGLTCQFFYPDQEIPLPIQMIQDCDIWQWKVKDSNFFCDGFYTAGFAMDTNEEKFAFIDEVLTNSAKITELINLGRYLDAKKQKTIANIANYATKKEYTYNFDNNSYTVCIANCDHEIASDLGNHIAKNYKQFSFVVLWRYSHDKEEYWYSLRSIGNVDISAIAKHYSGGGHKNAAGFASVIHPSILFSNAI
jgi:uncharacterized protein